MTQSFAAPATVSLGDPAPWFSARSLNGGELHLHVNAGRWVVLSFFTELSSPRAQEEFLALVSQLSSVTEDKMVGYAVLTAPADTLASLLPTPVPTLRLVADYDGALTRAVRRQGYRRAPSCSTRCCARWRSFPGTIPTAIPRS